MVIVIMSSIFLQVSDIYKLLDLVIY